MKKNKLMKVSMAALAVAMGIGYLRPTVLVTPVHAEEQTVSTTSTAATSQTLIDEKTTWKYLDNNTDPGTSEDLQSWTKADYDDSEWKTAKGSFGAKKGNLAAIGTVTPNNLITQYYTDVNDVDGDGDKTENVNIPAYFFRTTFNLDEIVEDTVVKGTVQYDDGAIVYLNGKAVAYFGGAENDASANTTTNLYYLANGTGNEGAGDPATGTFTIEASELSKGKNVIAVEVHNKSTGSSDVFFGMSSLTLESVDTSSVTQDDVILTVGSDETQRNLTWYADVNKAGTVQVAKAGNTDEFPTEYKEFKATASVSNEGLYTNQATITGLEANTKYVYRLVNGETVSGTYSFETGSTGDFTFALVGDPQIGASGNSTSDTESWGSTVNYIVNTLDPDFLLSAGDQVNTASSET
ncbi:MAG: fibronectin type III domain-containing protein, partial [Bacilli bacterium]|nr:fibronectin type III domain-containing protein [Bacilli bacterium]